MTTNLALSRRYQIVIMVAVFVVPAIIAIAQTTLDYRKPAGAEWPVVGGDWGNTRYSALSQINVSNVKTLKGAWMARLSSGFGPGFSQQATPVVKDGVMYITTGEQDIFAIDAKSGNILWEYRLPWDRRTPDNKAKRGVGLGEGLVFGVEVDVRVPAASTTPSAQSRQPAVVANQASRSDQPQAAPPARAVLEPV